MFWFRIRLYFDSNGNNLLFRSELSARQAVAASHDGLEATRRKKVMMLADKWKESKEAAPSDWDYSLKTI